MHVREPRPTDLGIIQDLLRQLGYEVPADEAERRLRSVTENAQHRVFVAEDEGKAVGFIHVFERPSLEKGVEAVVQAMVVDNAWRRKGVGAALMREAEKWAAGRGLGSVSLHTRADRADAHTFYERGGFLKAATVSLMRKETNAI